MKNMEFNKIFTQLGFSNNKTKVYLAALSLGSASVTEISKKAEIIRTTTYKILEELTKEGLLEESVKNKVKLFVALSPVKLIELINNNKKATEAILPGLLDLFTDTGFRPKMKFYTGEQGRKKVYEDVLNLKNETIYTFSPIKNILEDFGETYVRHFLEKRAKNKTRRFALRQTDAKSKSNKEWEFYTTDSRMLREVKFLPPKITFSTLIQIYDNKIGVISSKKENYAFIIESQELTNLMKQIFEWFWFVADKK